MRRDPLSGVAIGTDKKPPPLGVVVHWPQIPDLFPKYFPGVQTKRDDLVIDIDREQLEERMEAYFDPQVSHAEMEEICSRALKETNRFEAEEIREYLQERGLLEKQFLRHVYRPMDLRWIYYEPETRLLGEKSPQYPPHVFDGNTWFVSQRKPRREWSSPQVIQSIGCLDLVDRSASCFPMYLNPQASGGDLFNQPSADAKDGEPLPNLTDEAIDYLERRSGDVETLFYHAMAVLHSPAFAQENEDALQQDWPRVPLPEDRNVLQESAELGREVATLLDVEQDAAGVESGSIRDELQLLGRPEHVEDDQTLDPSRDFALTAGWGYVIPPSTVMPNNGEIDRRAYTPEEEAALPDGAVERWGAETLDLYLNDRARWTNVPARVWDYTLGGYPVVKKWLSYREKDVLGRRLEIGEVRHVTHMVRRIAALLLLEPRLNANYEAVKATT